MKRIFTLTAALMLGIAAFADDFNLYYDSNDGATNTKIETVNNLQKITFENGNIVATRKDGTTTSLAISVVRRLFFSTEETVAIEDVKEETITNKKGEVYDLTGRKLDINLNQSKLPRGLYIVDGKKVLVK
jgi:hypothetical protein